MFLGEIYDYRDKATSLPKHPFRRLQHTFRRCVMRFYDYDPYVQVNCQLLGRSVGRFYVKQSKKPYLFMAWLFLALLVGLGLQQLFSFISGIHNVSLWSVIVYLWALKIFSILKPSE